MRRSGPLASPRLVLLAVALAASVLLALAGCGSKDTPRTVTEGAVESTGTVQAALPAVKGAPTGTNTNEVTKSRGVAATYPVKVSSFAKSFGRASWYPRYLPKGFRIQALDVVELEPGSGLVCDVTYSNGAKGLEYVQGSPKTRTYDVVSAGKVTWGSEKADVVYEDPSDSRSRRIIVYNRGANLAELSGDVSFAELKAVARSMVRVK